MVVNESYKRAEFFSLSWSIQYDRMNLFYGDYKAKSH